MIVVNEAREEVLRLRLLIAEASVEPQISSSQNGITLLSDKY